jgi:hypothetical protein
LECVCFVWLAGSVSGSRIIAEATINDIDRGLMAHSEDIVAMLMTSASSVTMKEKRDPL